MAGTFKFTKSDFLGKVKEFFDFSILILSLPEKRASDSTKNFQRSKSKKQFLYFAGILDMGHTLNIRLSEIFILPGSEIALFKVFVDISFTFFIQNFFEIYGS